MFVLSQLKQVVVFSPPEQNYSGLLANACSSILLHPRGEICHGYHDLIIYLIMKDKGLNKKDKNVFRRVTGDTRPLGALHITSAPLNILNISDSGMV